MQKNVIYVEPHQGKSVNVSPLCSEHTSAYWSQAREIQQIFDIWKNNMCL